MRFLILSCNTGEGHNSAAKAFKLFAEEMGDSCDIKDSLSFLSPEYSKIISKGHIYMYRNLPKLFGVGYRFEENHPPKPGNESFMFYLMTRGFKSLLELLNNSNYDAVVCTHIFSAMMMSKLRKNGSFNIPTYLVSTDYTCSPGFAECCLDGYFIPHESLREEFVGCGVPSDKIAITGIPINPSFYTSLSKQEAKRELRLENGRRYVLLACGSMGCGPIKTLTNQLPAMLPKDTSLIVICGNNKKLYNSLKKEKLHENVKVLGYTTRMPIYMDAVDIILTKPGGLSTTEASVKGLPMIFINAVPGCETRNLEFFISNGLADTRKDGLELARLVCHYLNNPYKLEKMRNRLLENFSFCAVEKMYNQIKAFND